MDAPKRQEGEGLLADRGLRALFDRFPLALALTDPATGRRIVNARFGALLDASSLDLPAVAAIVAAPGLPPQRLALPSAHGGTLQANVHALPAPDGVMLVIDDAPARGVDRELSEMRARIAELELLSATDRLTGAWNRAHLDRTIGTELGRSLRFRQPISLILLDLDHFKDVNDTHGHAAGDAVLRELVAVLRDAVRSSDLVFRWGGEEFVVLASNASYRAAAGLAEKLRSAVARHAFPGAGSITVSGGVAEYMAGESAEAWFGRVDAALYEAKSGGRNRICVDRRGSSDLWGGVGGRSALRLDWLEEYECGEPTIDRQHRELFELANALLDATAGTEPRAGAVKAAFARLVAHVDGHFRDEEALLEKAGYPQLEAHARAHARLRERALELQKAADAGDIPFGPVVDFLANEVVARHLFTADRDFYPLFAARAGTA